MWCEVCVWLSLATKDTKTAIFFTLSRLQSVRSQREWKLILTQGIREEKRAGKKKKKKKKEKKKKPEMCRNNEIFLCFLGRYGMMQTDAQLTSSPKDTDAHKNPQTHTRARTHKGGTFNHNFKTTRIYTSACPHTPILVLFECMKHARTCTYTLNSVDAKTVD